MELRGDERGQAVQVGAVLLLAIFVVTLSLYQATVIPGENKQVEFNDYREATGDLADLRNAILRAAAEDAQTGTTVKTGSQYPARSLFINPPPATGRLSSSPPANVTISNVESAGEFGNVGTYLAAEGNALNVSTRRLVFDPSYNELDVAPIATAYGATYRAYDDPVFTTDQTLVAGNRITLVSVDGDLSAGGQATPVTVEPVSAHTRTVSVASDGDPLNVTVPTELSASVWEDRLLAGQMAPAGHVEAVEPGPRPGTVNVSLAAGQTYELRIARVEVRERSDASAAGAPDARYLVATTDTDTQTSRDGRVALTVEARDRFNNPVSNEDVTFNQSSGSGTFETKTGDNVSFPIRTGEDGRATVYYNATGHLGTIPVDAWLGTSDPPEDERDVRFRVFNNVLGGDGGGGGSSGEQAGRNLVVLEDVSGVTGQSDDDLQFTINNTGQYDVNVTGYRVDYVTSIQPNGGLVEGPTAITQMTFDGSAMRAGDAYEGGRPYLFGSEPVVVSPGTHTIDTTFNNAFGRDSDGKNNNIQGVFIGVSIYLEGEITVTFTVHIIL